MSRESPSSDLTRGPLALAGDSSTSAAGLEVVTWLSAADPSAIARAVEPFAQAQTHLSAHTRDLWRACGFRIVAVDLAALDQLHAALAAAPSVERAWLGQALVWTEAVRGPELPRGAAIATDADRLDLPRGRLRLLARAWLAPVPPDDPVSQAATNSPTPTGAIRREPADPARGSTDEAGTASPPPAAARVHLELLPQHHPSASRASRERAALTLDAPDGLNPADRQGLLFRRLLLSALLPPGHVLMIIPEDPAADWSQLAALPPREPTVTPPAAIQTTERDGNQPSVGRVSRPAGSTAPAVDDRDRGDWGSALAAPTRPSKRAAPAGALSPPATLAQRIARNTPDQSADDSPRLADAAGPSSDLTAGPPSPRIPTIGEAMLITRAPPPKPQDPGRGATGRAIRAADDRLTRTIILLIPRAPAEYRLLQAR